MPSVISVQSHVCYGHVGNSAAVFPMQKLGVEVHSIPTTVLSNHPAHSSVYGRAIESLLLHDLFLGLEDRGAFKSSDGILSGYLASVENAKVIANAIKSYKQLKPKGLYCLDPVMGDRGKGLFVSEGIPELIIDQLLPLADIITPNKFEFDVITQTNAKTFSEMISVARLLIKKNSLRCVVVTSAEQPVDKGKPKIGVLVVKAETAWLISTPYLAVSPSGAGDLFTGLFVGWIVRGFSEQFAAQKAICALYRIIELTLSAGKEELDIITHQDCIINDIENYPLKKCE
ncbi:pyridoxal kinase [Kiloniella sp.]|uniref:pyridoxal kinase n=1 Tax=Kiloniella sp. TaxID=1938587 RepID=UPI003B02450B